MRAGRELVRKATAAAASLNGKSLAMLVASSLVATSGVVASALSGQGGIGPLAAAAARSLLEQQPSAIAPSPVRAPASAAGPDSPPPPSAPSPEPAPSVPLTAPAAATPEATAPQPETPTRPPVEPEAPGAGPIKHVFLISLASPGFEAAFGPTDSQMPYLSENLRPQGVLLTDYSLLDPAATANGFASISGQAPTAASKAGCPEYERCLFPVETLTLADQLGTAGFSWRAYLGGMADPEGRPANCVHPEPDGPEAAGGAYSATLNPFVYFHSLLDLGDCAAADVPLSDLAGDLKKAAATAEFSYIAPDLCDSGFPGRCQEGEPDGPTAADNFLAELMPRILASPAYRKDGLVIVSFGAAEPALADPSAAPDNDPLKVGGLLVSPLLNRGGTDGAAYNPYSLLRSIEELFGLPQLGQAEAMKARSFASAFLAGETPAGD